MNNKVLVRTISLQIFKKYWQPIENLGWYQYRYVRQFVKIVLGNSSVENNE